MAEGTDVGVATADAFQGAGRDFLWLSLSMVASLAAAFVYMAATGEAAGYGRYSSSAPMKPGRKRRHHQWLVGARLAWCLQELPALLWPLLLGMDQGALVWRSTPNLILWGLFVFHYFNRCDRWSSLKQLLLSKPYRYPKE